MQIEEPLMKENEVLFMLNDANQQIEEPLPRSAALREPRQGRLSWR